MGVLRDKFYCNKFYIWRDKFYIFKQSSEAMIFKQSSEAMISAVMIHFIYHSSFSNKFYIWRDKFHIFKHVLYTA